MTARPTLVVFLGGLGGSHVEEIVGAARWAASLDAIETALSGEAFGGAVLVTDDAALAADVAGVTVDLDRGDFHFGRRLAQVLRRHAIASAVYMGGGSVPLFATADFAAVAGAVAAGRGVTNNAYSSDLVGFPLSPVAQGPSPERTPLSPVAQGPSPVGTPLSPVAQGPSPEGTPLSPVAEGPNPVGTPLSPVAQGPSPERILQAIETVDRDNALSRALAERAGLSIEALPRTCVTQMDIDAPGDLAVLSLTGGGGCRLQAYLGSLELDVSAYRRVLPLFTDTRAQIVVAGRVGSHAWQYLERETACRVRLFAEERGMEAEGRVDGGTARSLLGFYLDAVGVARFFRTLAELGDAAFIDTRVLLAHKRFEASRADRYLSDLGRWREVRDPWLREFTQAAGEAPVPVVLGGHSLMSGGLMALNEHAWQLRDKNRRRKDKLNQA